MCVRHGRRTSNHEGSISGSDDEEAKHMRLGHILIGALLAAIATLMGTFALRLCRSHHPQHTAGLLDANEEPEESASKRYLDVVPSRVPMLNQDTLVMTERAHGS